MRPTALLFGGDITSMAASYPLTPQTWGVGQEDPSNPTTSLCSVGFHHTRLRTNIAVFPHLTTGIGKWGKEIKCLQTVVKWFVSLMVPKGPTWFLLSFRSFKVSAGIWDETGNPCIEADARSTWLLTHFVSLQAILQSYDMVQRPRPRAPCHLCIVCKCRGGKSDKQEFSKRHHSKIAHLWSP